MSEWCCVVLVILLMGVDDRVMIDVNFVFDMVYFSGYIFVWFCCGGYMYSVLLSEVVMEIDVEILVEVILFIVDVFCFKVLLEVCNEIVVVGYILFV